MTIAQGLKVFKVQHFTQEQREQLINKVVGLIAAEEEQDFFKGVLHCVASETTSAAAFASILAKLLHQYDKGDGAIVAASEVANGVPAASSALGGLLK